ncbi:MAG TPA: VOC family protein [Steroidobacteraceae bacterium]|nr:VOC family protein [Steroidobacteraceae bacterium]
MKSLPLPIRQIAYFVPDVRRAAAQHHELHGSGPYYVAEHIPLRASLHRGVQRPLDHTSAYGQWGEVMIEFVQQNNPEPSAFHDLYPHGSGRGGIHHVALFVEDLCASIDSYAREGAQVALLAEMNDGFRFAMIDTVRWYGHLLELYQPEPPLVSFYEFVAKAARRFDGTDPIRTITFGSRA